MVNRRAQSKQRQGIVVRTSFDCANGSFGVRREAREAKGQAALDRSGKAEDGRSKSADKTRASICDLPSPLFYLPSAISHPNSKRRRRCALPAPPNVPSSRTRPL